MDNGGVVERLIGVCCLGLIAALFTVGLGAHEEVRHLIQLAPVCLVAVFGFRGSSLARWAGAAIFLLWLGIVSLIVLHLTGVAHIITGEFSDLEIAMLWVMGVACGLGLSLAAVSRAKIAAPAALAVFLLTAGLGAGALWVSLLPVFAHDNSDYITVD